MPAGLVFNVTLGKGSVEKDIGTEAAAWRYSVNSQESTCARVSFLIKLQVSGLQFY